MPSLRWEMFIAFSLRATRQEAFTHFLRFASHQTTARRRTSILVKTNPFLFWKARSSFRLVTKRSQPNPGAFIQGPRGIAHSFRNNTQRSARILGFVAPAGFENFFKEFAKRVASFDSPAIPVSKDEIDKLLAAAPKYGLQILPPNN